MRPGAALSALLAAGITASAGAQDLDASHWGLVPSRSQIAAAYPAAALAAGQEGSSSMTCTANRVGVLEACIVDREDPRGAGFGAAELKLADDFRLIPDIVDGRPTALGKVTIPVKWTLAATKGAEHQVWSWSRPQPPTTGVPVGVKWRRRPSSYSLGGTYPANAYEQRLPGWASVACRANAKGQLHDCAVVEENPSGNGFGEAALRFVPTYFQLESKADDGSSVEGLKVSIKLSWAMTGLQYSCEIQRDDGAR
jgi:hypothetical protein